jgi:hypothetical protein
MSLHRVHISAHLTGHSFTPGELIGWKLVVVAREGAVIVPDPLSGSDALTLKLRGPTGKTEVVRLGDLPGPPGVIEMPDGRLLPPGGKVVFEDDVATYFPNIGFGPHWLQLEYTVDGEVWRSPELPFQFVPGHASFLDVTPNEATRNGWNGVLWVEHGPSGPRAMMFEEDTRARSVAGAFELAAVPADAEPALGSRPANWPFPERWVAWISGETLHLQYHADADPEHPGNTLHPPPAKLPAALHQPRIVSPLLDEWVPDRRPRSTVPVLAKNADGTETLHLLEIDPHGRVAPKHVIPIPGVAAGCWGVSPAVETRVLAYALAGAGQVSLFGVELPWHGHALAPAPRRWIALEADAFLAGDLRCTFEGPLWMGALVRRGHDWERVVFIAPVGARAGTEAEILHRSSFTPPEGAEAVRAGVDPGGELHVLYRRGKQLAYVPPGETKATFTSDRLGASAPATARLVLGPGRRRVLAAYDPERGPVWQAL